MERGATVFQHSLQRGHIACAVASKIADLQAENTSHRDTFSACRSAIFAIFEFCPLVPHMQYFPVYCPSNEQFGSGHPSRERDGEGRSGFWED